jgi:hypothetical protein
MSGNIIGEAMWRVTQWGVSSRLNRLRGGARP